MLTQSMRVHVCKYVSYMRAVHTWQVLSNINGVQLHKHKDKSKQGEVGKRVPLTQLVGVVWGHRLYSKEGVIN